MPIFRASELDRLFTCPGSGFLPRVQRPEGVSAAWGSKVHAWLETGLLPEGKDGAEIKKRVEKSGVKRGVLWPLEGEHEVAYAYHILSGRVVRYVAPNPLPVGYDSKAHKSAWKDAFDDEWATGTLDYASEVLDSYWVDDLKTGRRVHWKDHQNQQFFYCLCRSIDVYGEIRAGRSTVTHWPRYPIANPPTRLGVAVEADHLKTFAASIYDLRELILRNRAKADHGLLLVTDQCYFCPSRTHCPKINSSS